MTMTKPRVSIVAVVIDTLNETQRFVSSIRDHTDVPYELILIDNASKNTRVRSYVKKNADVAYRFEKRASLEHAEFQYFTGPNTMSPFGSFAHFKRAVAKNGLPFYKPYLTGKKLFYLRTTQPIPSGEITEVAGVQKR